METSWLKSVGFSFLMLILSLGVSQASGLTPSVVWDHSDAIYRQCNIPDFDCVKRLMQASGGSREALEFLDREQAWVIGFTEYGNTDLLLLETFRANTNQFYALVTVQDEVIHAEGYNLSIKDKERQEVQKVLAQHPQAFFIAKPDFLRHEARKSGESRFVFLDYLAECRACKPLATGELIYEFDETGRYLWVKLGDFTPLQ